MVIVDGSASFAVSRLRSVFRVLLIMLFAWSVTLGSAIANRVVDEALDDAASVATSMMTPDQPSAAKAAAAEAVSQASDLGGPPCTGHCADHSICLPCASPVTPAVMAFAPSWPLMRGHSVSTWLKFSLDRPPQV